MSEIEKQESQKTIVAFITGLLIGGLLVWVFSASPEEKKEPTVDEDTTEVVEDSKKDTEIKSADVTVTPVSGEGKIEVTDQKAGIAVELGEVSVPTERGWVVVKDYMDGVPGSILGAARFDTAAGLMPTSVPLIRPTLVGSSYQVVFYTDGGDTGFAVADDVLIDGVSATFKSI